MLREGGKVTGQQAKDAIMAYGQALTQDGGKALRQKNPEAAATLQENARIAEQAVGSEDVDAWIADKVGSLGTQAEAAERAYGGYSSHSTTNQYQLRHQKRMVLQLLQQLPVYLKYYSTTSPKSNPGEPSVSGS